MKKILVVFTGGTIGSKVQKDNVIDVDESTAYELIQAFKSRASIDVQFDTTAPLNILSENLLPMHWEKLYDALVNKDFSLYEGIIITHGTDTLPYSTAIISFLFGGTGLPIVFVASNYAIDHPQSNGVHNFISAVEFIINEKRPGVFCIYKNPDEKTKVFLGTRLLSMDETANCYTSYQNMDFGLMNDNKFLLLNDFDAKKTVKSNSYPSIKFSKKILGISIYPGLDYSFFDFSKERPAAVLHTLYHSSTACVAPPAYSIIEFANKCKDLKIDLYLLDSRNYLNDHKYATSDLFTAYDVKFLTGISYEAAYTKLALAYNQNRIDPHKYMEEELFFEYIR